MGIAHATALSKALHQTALGALPLHQHFHAGIRLRLQLLSMLRIENKVVVSTKVLPPKMAKLSNTKAATCRA
jgi:hypothetical protein